MKKKPLLPAILAWLAGFLTLTICGALCSAAGCESAGPSSKPIVLSEGLAGGALFGLIVAWVCAIGVYAGTDEITFSDIDAQRATPEKKEWS